MDCKNVTIIETLTKPKAKIWRILKEMSYESGITLKVHWTALGPPWWKILGANFRKIIARNVDVYVHIKTWMFVVSNYYNIAKMYVKN